MEEKDWSQILADFSATKEAKPNLTEAEWLQKFPEFGNNRDMLQAAFDYDATVKSGKYKDPMELQSKFPEFWPAPQRVDVSDVEQAEQANTTVAQQAEIPTVTMEQLDGAGHYRPRSGGEPLKTPEQLEEEVRQQVEANRQQQVAQQPVEEIGEQRMARMHRAGKPDWSGIQQQQYEQMAAETNARYGIPNELNMENFNQVSQRLDALNKEADRIEQRQSIYIDDDVEPSWVERDQRRIAELKGERDALRAYITAYGRTDERQDFEQRLGSVLDQIDQENTAQQAWNHAEELTRAEQNVRNEQIWNNYAAMGGGREMRMMATGETYNANASARMKYHDLQRMADEAWDMLGSEKQQAIVGEIYNILKDFYPDAEESALRENAERMARQQSDRRVYDLAVENNTPKNTADYFFRKMIGANSVVMMMEALARSSAGTTGDLQAREEAERNFDQGWNKVAGIGGTVVGLAADPLMWMSGGAGGAAERGFLYGMGKYAGEAATRRFATTLGGRMAVGAVRGGASFGTYEAGKETLNQLKWGGEITGADPETGLYVIGDYNGKQILGSFGHGVLMGGVTGVIAPGLGNVSDNLVRATESTVGKAGIRTGELAVGTVAEGTVFAAPEFINTYLEYSDLISSLSDENSPNYIADENERAQAVDRLLRQRKGTMMDVWTDNMAMVAGFKAQHVIKSIPTRIAELQANPNSKAGFETRLRSVLDGNRRDLALTKEEKMELEAKGYNDLEGLVSSLDGIRNSTGLVKDGQLPYNRFLELMKDKDISESARAKMYYYLTGNVLPMSTVIGGRVSQIMDDNGNTTGWLVQSFGQNGVITNRMFNSEKAARAEESRIFRQTELNMAEIGERKFDQGKKEGEMTSDAVRKAIFRKYFVDVYQAIKKEPNRRSKMEQEAVQEYLNTLWADEINEADQAKRDAERQAWDAYREEQRRREEVKKLKDASEQLAQDLSNEDDPNVLRDAGRDMRDARRKLAEHIGEDRMTALEGMDDDALANAYATADPETQRLIKQWLLNSGTTSVDDGISQRSLSVIGGFKENIIKYFNNSIESGEQQRKDIADGIITVVEWKGQPFVVLGESGSMYTVRDVNGNAMILRKNQFDNERKMSLDEFVLQQNAPELSRYAALAEAFNGTDFAIGQTVAIKDGNTGKNVTILQIEGDKVTYTDDYKMGKDGVPEWSPESVHTITRQGLRDLSEQWQVQARREEAMQQTLAETPVSDMKDGDVFLVQWNDKVATAKIEGVTDDGMHIVSVYDTEGSQMQTSIDDVSDEDWEAMRVTSPDPSLEEGGVPSVPVSQDGTDGTNGTDNSVLRPDVPTGLREGEENVQPQPEPQAPKPIELPRDKEGNIDHSRLDPQNTETYNAAVNEEADNAVAFTALGDAGYLNRNIDAAKKGLEKAEKTTPKSTGAAQLKAELADLNAKKQAARNLVDFWENVRKELERRTSPDPSLEEGSIPQETQVVDETNRTDGTDNMPQQTEENSGNEGKISTVSSISSISSTGEMEDSGEKQLEPQPTETPTEMPEYENTPPSPLSEGETEQPVEQPAEEVQQPPMESAEEGTEPTVQQPTAETTPPTETVQEPPVEQPQAETPTMEVPTQPIAPQKPKPTDPWTRARQQIGEPTSAYEAILLDIMNGTKFKWGVPKGGGYKKDKDTGKRVWVDADLGIGDLWGYKAGERDKRKGMLDDNGFTVETYAEALQQGKMNDAPWFDNMDLSDIRDLVEEALQYTTGAKSAKEQLLEARQKRIEEEQRQIRAIQDANAKALGFEDADDMEAYYNSLKENVLSDEEYEELNRIFAEQIQEEDGQRTGQGESEADSREPEPNEREGVPGEGEGGTGLLQTEQSPDTETAERPRQGEGGESGGAVLNTPQEPSGAAEVRDEIDKLKAQRANLAKQRDDLQKRYEQANGLFGDMGVGENSIQFEEGQNFLAPDLAQTTIDGYNNKIKKIDEEIKRLEASLERAKEVTQTEIGGENKTDRTDETDKQPTKPESREELDKRLKEERKQRILKEGTNFDQPFGLVPVSETMTAEDIETNVGRIVQGLKDNEGSGNLDQFYGYAYQGAFGVNAGEQVKDYIDSLYGVVPMETLKAWYDSIGLKTYGDLVKYGKELYDNTQKTEQNTVPQPEKKEEKKPEKLASRKIDDVGEKIEGARKDLAKKLSTKIDLEAETFPKMFPKFDLKKLVGQGLDPKLASAVMFLRQAAYADYKRDLKHKRKEHALGGSRFMAAYAKHILENADTDVEFTDNRWVFTDYGKIFVKTNIALYEKIHEKMGDDMFGVDLSDYKIDPINTDGKLNYTAFRRNENGEEEKFTPYYQARAKSGTFYFKEDELDKAINLVLGKIERGVSYEKSHPFKLNVYYTRGTSNQFYVGVKIGNEVEKLTENFSTSNEALAYLNEHNAELQEKSARLSEQRKEEKKQEKPVAKVEIIQADKSKGYSGGYVFAVKLGKEYVRIIEDVYALPAIYRYEKEHRDELQQMAQQKLDQYLEDVEKGKGWKPQLNLGGGRTRVGEDYRQGRDVSGDEFREAFGFRGVQFGNYVTQKERQRFLNEAYDALMDLADLIGVSPKALSLGGQLGFAIGARGGGGANAAHYEPGENVINLTKTQGAGSLAHEWWHALDYYFNREGENRRKSATAVTEAGDFSEGVRKEMRDAFIDLMGKINGSDYLKRSKALERRLHPSSVGVGYFDKPTELGARAFQDYVSRRLTERGQVNDFLSSFTPEEQWNGEAKTYPYPTGEDATAIDEMIDKLFGTIEEKQDEHGNAVLYHKVGEEVELTKEEVELRDHIVGFMKEFLGEDSVITDSEEAQRVLDEANGKIREQRVYHNSPHFIKKADGSFVDPETGERLGFDHRFMGTGEGAQVHGWGSYFSVDDLRHYGYGGQRAEVFYKGEKFNVDEVGDDLTANGKDAALKFIVGHHAEDFGVYDTAEKAINAIDKYIEADEIRLQKKDYPLRDILLKDYYELIAARDYLEENGYKDIVVKPNAHHYDVDIPENNGVNYFEENEPLKPEQIKALKEQSDKEGKQSEIGAFLWYANPEKNPYADKYTFAKFLSDITSHMGGGLTRRQASEFFSRAGFTGIHYIGQRDGEGYVIFNENDAKITEHIRFFRTPSGEAYGFTVGGKVYIDPRIATAETPIHEYAHLYGEAIRRANPEAWEHLKQDLLGHKDVLDYVKGLYPKLEGDELMDEVWAHFSGKRGAEYMRAEQKRMMDEAEGYEGVSRVAAIFDRIRKALKKFWNMARDLFAGNNEKLKDMKAEDFADMMMNDFANKFDPRTVKGKGDVFVSNAARAVEGIKQEKATPEQWLKMIEKNGGLKAGEDKWIGLSEWLKDSDAKTLTKQEVLDFINENMVQVEEVEYGGSLFNINSKQNLESDIARAKEEGESVESVLQLWDKMYGMGLVEAYQNGEFTIDENGRVNIDQKMLQPINSTRLQYTTEGLDNKREIALTVPTIEPWNEGDEIHFGDAGGGRAVAWVRFGETTDKDGNRVLVIDEIQSKRHQEGREKGYGATQKEIEAAGAKWEEKAKERDKYFNELCDKYGVDSITELAQVATDEEYDKYRGLIKEALEEQRKYNELRTTVMATGAVPAAPFEKNWMELAMKRMLRLAAEEGYDKVAWTTGEQQAKRYSLSTTISKIEKERKNRDITYVDLTVADTNGIISLEVNNDGVVEGVNQSRYDNFVGQPLSNVIGKEWADEVLNSRKRTFNTGEMAIGGEGMKGFYDKMIPSFMNKYGKQWGVKVGEVTLPNVEEAGRTMWAVDVTDAMKESVMQGQPMFSLVGRQGAQRLDMKERAMTRLNNLHTAREMEQQGKDAKAIRLATGWERGKDGKWRFEIGEASLEGVVRKLAKPLNDTRKAFYEADAESSKLFHDAQILDDRIPKRLDSRFTEEEKEKYRQMRKKRDEMIDKAYERIADRNDLDDKIKNGTFELRLGDIIPEDDELLIAYPQLKDTKIEYQLKPTIEGGAEGSYDDKTNTIKLAVQKDASEVYSTLYHEIQHAIQGIEGFAQGGNLSTAIKDKEVRELLEKELNAKIDELKKREKAESKDYSLDIEDAEFALEQLKENKLPVSVAFEYYKRIAGEVEARNVQKRLGLTPEQRREALLADTEDVAREDQIVLMEGSEAMSASEGEENPVEPVSDEELNSYDSGRMSHGDIVANTLVELANKNKENVQRRIDAVRALGNSLQKVRQAMAAQRAYDKTTVDQIVRLAQIMMKGGMFKDFSNYEVRRLLSMAKNATGRNDITKQANAVVNLMLDHALKEAANILDGQLKVRGSKVGTNGVEVQGKLDITGQRMMAALKDGMELDPEALEERIADAIDRMGSDNKAVADNAALEHQGLMLAKQYHDDITQSEAEESNLRNELKKAKEDLDAGTMTREQYKEFEKATQSAILKNKANRIGAYINMVNSLGSDLRDFMGRAKAFREREEQRIKEIQHNANSDMQGKPASEHSKPTRAQRVVNSSLVRFFMKPIATFDEMLRFFGSKSVDGQGYLWNRFMGGFVDAADNEWRNLKKDHDELDAKVSEVMGEKMRWSDLFAMERKMKPVVVKFMDGGVMKEHELSQGNALYIYMVNKMEDGQMKLRRMGITEDDVEKITNQLNPKFKELADWMQDVYLPKKREDFNAVHERMFGAPMAAIEDYFPLVINSRSRGQEEDIGKPNFGETKPSTITGSIIKRTANATPLDLTNADAFDVLLGHLRDMEHWAAFAELNRDMNTLLSYKHFKNQVLNTTSVRFGGGETLWKNFKDVCAIAADVYHPRVDRNSLDNAMVNISKGVTSAKISFRLFTAFKQLLSYPAYFSEANAVELVKSTVKPAAAFNWALDELPGFAERWQSRQAGDSRLKDTDADWDFWRNKIVDTARRWGMTPNAFVDGLTVAMGAKAIYESKMKRYKADGYSEEEAKQKALKEASIAYNETQQSNQNAYLSAMQLDRTVASVALTVFRNASMGYQRRMLRAIDNIRRKFMEGYKEESIAFMAKQGVRSGLSEEQAQEAAEKAWKRSVYQDIANTVIFGFVMQMAWNLGAYLPYLLFGDDDDEKDKLLEDAALHTLAGPIEGLTGGSVISELYNMARSGKDISNYSFNLLPIMSDLQNTLKHFKQDDVRGWNDVVNLLIQAGVGVNPQTISDAAVAIVDATNGDLGTAKEIGFLLLRMSQVPQSQLDQLYIDELGMSAKDAKGLDYETLAKRYAEYKANRDAPLTGWLYSDESRQKAEQRYMNRFQKMIQERIAEMDEDDLDRNMDGDNVELKRLLGKEIASRLEGKDTEGNKPSSNWKEETQRAHLAYQRNRDYIDVVEDVLLRKAQTDADAEYEAALAEGDYTRAAQASARANAIEKARKQIGKMKASLGLADGQYDAQIMENIRATRKQYMQAYGIR